MHRLLLLGISISHLSAGFSQINFYNEKRWSTSIGESFSVSNKQRGYDLRFLTPKFAMLTDKDYLPEKWEKIPDSLKKYELSIESTIYQPFFLFDNKMVVFKLIGNLHKHFYTFKKLNLFCLLGLFNEFWITLYSDDSPSTLKLNFIKPNGGFFAKIDWKIISPYCEVYLTRMNKKNYLPTIAGGLNFKLQNIPKKLKKRYNLHLKSKYF